MHHPGDPCRRGSWPEDLTWIADYRTAVKRIVLVVPVVGGVDVLAVPFSFPG